MNSENRPTVAVIALGCCKNDIDAEKMAANLAQNGFEITGNPDGADAVIINTCGFIEDATRESIDAVLEAVRLKSEGKTKAVIVTGCMAERYREQVAKEIPEVDAVAGIGANGEIARTVQRVLSGEKTRIFPEKSSFSMEGDRILLTPPFTAYIKIAEGCDNRCSYCAIPSIRGGYRSREIGDILSEAVSLAQNGVRELIVTAQDTTRYGEDIYGEPRLPQLLRSLSEIGGFAWIRTLYTYPERISDELIETVANTENIVKYFDIPIQHCSDGILRRMNRKSSRKSLETLLCKIREHVEGVTLRTTLMTGFPGETDDDFNELCEFVKEQKFDRLGCFAYSAEDGTPAALYPDQVPPQVRADRADTLMKLQSEISLTHNREKVGRTLTALCEGCDGESGLWHGRGECDAPEVDGEIFFNSDKPVEPGEFVSVKITGCDEYDLRGERI